MGPSDDMISIFILQKCIFLYAIPGLPLTVKDLPESPKEKSQGAKKERKGLLDILVLFIAWSFAAYYVGFFIVFLSLVLYCSLELPNAEWLKSQLFNVRNMHTNISIFSGSTTYHFF